MDPLSTLPNLKRDLERVESRLILETSAEQDILTEVANHLIHAGGKRIRPGFAITAACLGMDYSADEDVSVSDDVVTGATAVELVHLGSLYHDDVMDGAKKRRNVESVNSKYGDHTAILAGDFLLARASILIADLGNEASKLLASTIARLCEGQIMEHRDIDNLERTPTDYMHSIEGKTASLLSTACRIGATVGNGSSAKYADQAAEFGLAYGMAFQVIDDISDLMTDGSEMGKPGGNDLAEGNYTLPLLYAFGEGGITSEELQKLLVEKRLEEARELVAKSAGLDKAVCKAREFTKRAESALLAIRGDESSNANGTTADGTGSMDTLAVEAFESALQHLMHRLAVLV